MTALGKGGLTRRKASAPRSLWGGLYLSVQTGVLYPCAGYGSSSTGWTFRPQLE